MAQNQATRKVVVVQDAGKLSARVEQIDAVNAPREPGGKIPWAEMRQYLREDLEPTERTAGKHFALLAPTRGGKTTLVTRGLIPVYREVEVPVLVLDTTADPKLAKFGDRIPRWGDMTGLHRLTIDSLSIDNVRKVYDVVQRAFKQGDILIYVDEIRHVCDKRFMGLGSMMEHLWLFGGKRGVTVGGATQAPRWVPGSFYDQSSAHFLFRIRDERSRKRVQEISGDTKTLQAIIPDLPRWNFAYVSPEGDVSISKLDLPRGGEQERRRD